MANGEIRSDAAGEPGEELPEWNLDDLYPGPRSAEIRDDLDRTRDLAGAFATRYRGQVAGLAGNGLVAAIAEYEAIDETLSRLASYASLLHAGDLADPEIGTACQDIREDVATIAADLVFFRLEIAALPDRQEDAGRYGPWIRDVGVFRDYQLDPETERLLHEKDVVGRQAWIRLYDETLADLKFPVRGEECGIAGVSGMLADPDPALRREAGASLGRVLGENIRVFALITNTLARDREIEDRWRGLPGPVTWRNLHNLVEDEVVEALTTAVRRAWPSLSHRYYAIKARNFGVGALDWQDRNAPWPDADTRMIPWPEARQAVLGAWRGFLPEMAAIGERFFDGGWIDAGLRPGKASGAFSHPTVPGVHPYILLNYQGRPRDAMTLAHELGHGIHQVVAGEQGHLLSATPLTLAETASVFGEMLAFRSLLEAAPDIRTQRALLAGKIEDMLNTVTRQIALFEFEKQVHARRREGELTPDQLDGIWLETQIESLGPAIRMEGGARHLWARIPHFIHAPFYVYAYAFGDCLVNSLYALYEEAPEGFAEKYLEMLRAGGTLRHGELLAPFGLDAGDPELWDRGLRVIGGMIDRLEALEGK